MWKKPRIPNPRQKDSLTDSLIYTPFVLVLAFVVGLVTRNVELAITILVLGCPGALVIGVPIECGRNWKWCKTWSFV